MAIYDNQRGSFLDLLLQLAIKSCVVPKCLEVHGIAGLGKYPVESGGFGDIWKAMLGDRSVALKTLRPMPDQERIHRVRSPRLSPLQAVSFLTLEPLSGSPPMAAATSPEPVGIPRYQQIISTISCDRLAVDGKRERPAIRKEAA